MSPLALPDGTLLERHAEPVEVGEDRLLPACDGPRRIRVVDPEDEGAAAVVDEAPVGDGGQGVPEMQ
jgi:hypothetical protein